MSIGPELKRLGGKVSHLESQIRQHKANSERFKTERDQARTERNGLRKALDRWQAAASHMPDRIPRTIDPQELETETIVAIKDGKELVGAGEVEGVMRSGGEVSVALSTTSEFIDLLDRHTVVLLGYAPCCDTPTDQQEPERLTVKWSGERRGEPIDPQDIRDGDVVDKWTNGVRVAQDLTFDNQWIKDNFFYNHWDEFRLVYRPTPAPVTAETIRASEVGSTFDDVLGEPWEWDGEKIRKHTFSGGLGGGFLTPEERVSVSGPLARSSAAPRGDYGKEFRMADWEREMLDQQAQKVEAPRVGEMLRTAEQASALPVGTVVLSADRSTVFHKVLDGHWRNTRGGGTDNVGLVSNGSAPLKVLHIGSDTD